MSNQKVEIESSWRRSKINMWDNQFLPGSLRANLSAKRQMLQSRPRKGERTEGWREGLSLRQGLEWPSEGDQVSCSQIHLGFHISCLASNEVTNQSNAGIQLPWSETSLESAFWGWRPCWQGPQRSQRLFGSRITIPTHSWTVFMWTQDHIQGFYAQTKWKEPGSTSSILQVYSADWGHWSTVRWKAWTRM